MLAGHSRPCALALTLAVLSACAADPPASETRPGAGGSSGGTSPVAGTGGGSGGSGGSPAAGVWRRANLTNFESHPDPGSEECIRYGGCTWAGQFAFMSGRQTEAWVMANNIAAVHSRDGNAYKLKTLRLRQGARMIDVKVYDICSDKDCNGCCTRNAAETGFLIDIEKYTMQRFGSGDGIVDWMCVDC